MSDPPPNNQRYEQVKVILRAALDVAPGERSDYLDAACRGDAELRAEVVSMLAAQDDADGSFFDSTITALAGQPASGGEDEDLIGRRIGAYRVERLLGRGGMGAVYLASRDDGEFTRHVAVKFIRQSVATPSLLKRFRTERQILADIDHPNIARLIDGGTAEGKPFFIMEYVPGETLAQILARGPLSVDRALQLARSVAEVLETIHSKGLVFRDLKPSNIMFTSESGVKVLDFGVAKIMRGAGGDVSTTLTLTQPGRIVGSPRYMSPEQAAGDRVDTRSDVFSYGVVICEALTGRLPFAGQTRKEYFRNVVNGKPEPLPQSVPAAFRAVLERCLQPSPADRYESGKELVEAVRAVTVSTAGEARPTGARAMWIAAGIVTVLAITYGVWAANREKPSDSALLDGPPELVATWASSETSPRISPDLKWLSFISDRDGATKLWLVERSSGAERTIDPPGGDVTSHAWSPSSDRIAYMAPLGVKTSLTLAPIAGGQFRVVELKQSDAVLVRWIGDGIYYWSSYSLWRYDLFNEESKEITTQRGSLRPRAVDVSADERRIVFSASKDTVSSIFTAAIDGSAAVRLTENRMDPKYLRWRDTRAQDVVYVSEEGGMADVWQLNVATRLRRRLTVSEAREADLDVSADGAVLVYEQIKDEAHLAELDPSEKIPAVRLLTSDGLSDLLPSASAASDQIAFQRSTRIDMALGISSATIRLLRNGSPGQSEKLADGYAPEISPDGRWVAYSVWKPGAVAELWITNLTARRPLLVSDILRRFNYITFPVARIFTNLVWSRDGSRLYFIGHDSSNREEVYSAVPAADGQSVQVEQVTRLNDETSDVTDVQMSHDGARLSFLLRSGRRASFELHVVNLARKEDRVVFREKAGVTLSCPGWTATDDSIVVLRSAERQTQTDVLLAKADFATEVGRLQDATFGTVVLDPRSRVLYFARTTGSVNSLHALPLDSGQVRPVLQGDPHGPAFSGIRVLGNGRLLFSFQTQNRDILSNEFGK